MVSFGDIIASLTEMKNAARLVLQFLGSPQVRLDNTPVATDRRKAIALLAYLAVNDIGHPRQRYSRESLSALFWPEYEQAKAFTNIGSSPTASQCN